MPGPARRRIDLTRLPAWARYVIALVVVAAVVLLVVNLPGAAEQPADWYTTLVLVGAILLICWCVGWVAVRVARAVRRRPPDHQG
jgi:peptidoglycan/LPS O-acetylase OafA/YrhL